MSNSVPLCTHIKTNGLSCGSPAMAGTTFCFHHSAVKTALRARPSVASCEGSSAPFPFVFPEDRASMQINFFLLLQAYNEGQMDLRTYNCFLSLLRAMARNLGKTGSLVEETSDQRSTVSDQEEASGQPSAVSDRGQAVNTLVKSQPTSNERTSTTAGIANLNASSASLRAEACFLNTVSASAGRDPFAAGWMREQEARREGGGRRSPLL